MRPPHLTRAGHRIVQSSGVSRVGLRGGSKSRKLKWLVKVGAGKGDLKNHGLGGFPGNQKTPLDTPLQSTLLLSFFAAPEARVYKRVCLSINTVYGISLLFTTLYFKNQNKNAHSPADWSLCAFSPLVSIQLRERASWVQDIEECSTSASARWSHNLYYTFLFRHRREFWITCFGMLTN